MEARYRVEKEPIGAGGFGRVIKGFDTFLERDIAVKILDPLITQFDKREQERFKREARILAKISHPNIPSIYDVKFDTEEFLIIFEYVEGKTLRELIEGEGPCQIGEAKDWFQQIAMALDHSHNLGIVHRDIKPANIIITPDRQSAFLVDFGIALTKEDSKKLTKFGYAVGTPGYMSQEQTAGDEVDLRTDLYSLGVTLYETLAAKRPPLGSYEDLSAVNESIPPEIDLLIQDCLVPADQRINSAREFATKLAGALRPAKPLSAILAHGRLHELAAAIEIFNANEFVKLPKGQQALILTKLDDIVYSGEAQLERASERLLEILLDRGILLEDKDYRAIVLPAIQWGFEFRFNDYVGSNFIRRAIEKAAYNSGAEAHRVIREEFCDFVKELNLEEKEDRYLHWIRVLIQTLLANPECSEDVEELVGILRKVNGIQRSRGEASQDHE